MGDFLNPGHTYVDGSTVTGPNLTEHVAEATFKPAAITARTLRTPAAALTDQVLVVASDVLYQETLQQIHDLILYPGSIVQTVYGEYLANTNLTAIIPTDDTIPQNTEGTEIISISITPRFITSKILLNVQGVASLSVSGAVNSAIFRDSVVDAIAACMTDVANATWSNSVVFTYQDSPATTSATSYKLRVGSGDVGTLRMNGYSTTREFGGVMRTTMVAQEIKQ